MRLNPFTSKPPLDQESVDWIFEVFAWGLRHLGRDRFFGDTRLVLPDNDHFPGRVSSVDEMAGLMFDRTLAYAGMGAWPLTLSGTAAGLPDRIPPAALPTPLRAPSNSQNKNSPNSLAVPAPATIPIPYDAKLLNNPEAMIAGFAQLLAHYLGSAVTVPPPGGIRNWPQTTEVLGVFLGFGVLFANTAFNYRPSTCGSCSGPKAERQVALSQYDVTYALALFCVLKSIPNKQVTGPLKGSLRSYFKRCRRDVERRTEALAALENALPAPSNTPTTVSIAE